MIEVRIITTEGCEGCRIMQCIANNAIDFVNEYNKKIIAKPTVFDCLDESIRQFANRYQVKDYPATFILKDNKVVDRIFGTCTKQMMINTLTKYIG
jgi:hypothetical protein